MKNLLFVSCLSVVLCATNATPVAAQDHDEMIAAAEALDAVFAEAMNNGDAEAIAELYWKSPELVSFPPDQRSVEGFENVKASFAAMMESMPGAKLRFEDTHHIVAGEYVVSYGLFTLTLPLPDGGTTEMEGRFTDLKGQRDGKWVYIHDHGSMPLPPPPASPDQY